MSLTITDSDTYKVLQRLVADAGRRTGLDGPPPFLVALGESSRARRASRR